MDEGRQLKKNALDNLKIEIIGVQVRGNMKILMKTEIVFCFFTGDIVINKMCLMM